MMSTKHVSSRLVRLAGLGLAAGAVVFAAASSASAQDAYRDRGARYSRAQSSEGVSRARTRSDNNSRPQQARATEVVRSHNGGGSHNGSWNGGSSHKSHGSFNDPGSKHDSHSRITFGLNYTYAQPYYSYGYNYVPRYRTVQYYSPYTYPAYCPPTYYPATYYPATYVSYGAYSPPASSFYFTTHYSYRPYRYDCGPAYGYGYPRYYYPKSGLSFGVRYDFHW